MKSVKRLSTKELEAGLDHIRQAPKDNGVLKLLVRRPEVGERDVLVEGKLDLVHGLVGDNWKTRGSTGTPNGTAHPEQQLNIMNFRVISLLAGEEEHRPLAGDQLFVDMDLSSANLPPGTQLALGSAVIEVTAIPHNGCKKFLSRFGRDALKFVNSPLGKQLHLRGINAKVIRPGIIRVGDIIRKI
jgi:MOSC domain-containing protein YiiM